MRIVVGSIQQESNTLTSRVSHIGDFTIFRNEEMLSHIAVTTFLQESGCTLIPTLYAQALPGGPLLASDFSKLAKELVSYIPSEGIDGIWLHLHGSLFVEGIGSGEEAILKMIRDKVGDIIPISIALDFHANNTLQFLSYATTVVGYRTAPHVDIEETQVRAASLLLKCIKENLSPKLGFYRVPVVVPGDCVLTNEYPLNKIMKHAIEEESQQGVLVCNVFNGQPWVDAPYMGPSIVVYHENDKSIAHNIAKELAHQLFNVRKDFKFSVDAYEIDEALSVANSSGNRPVVFVSDSGDNTTAGASGDNAYVLSRVLALHMKHVLIGGITDAPCVAQCKKHGVGSTVDLSIGASIESSSISVNIKGVVVYIGPIQGWYGEDAGECCVVRYQSVDIIVTQQRCAFIRPSIFVNIGITLSSYRFVIVKLGYLFPELNRIASKSILALTKGTSTERLEDMNMKHITRPVYPLDDDFSI